MVSSPRGGSWSGKGRGKGGGVGAGVGAGAEGGGRGESSLAETVLRSRKAFQTPCALTHLHYSPHVDGVCAIGTPVLIVPIRGRGGACVGLLVCAKGAATANRSSSGGTVSGGRGRGSGSAENVLNDSFTSVYGGVEASFEAAESRVAGAVGSGVGRSGNAFSTEDVSVAEMISSFGALSLYWCQGLGSLHHEINRYVNKMDQLETIVKKLANKR